MDWEYLTILNTKIQFWGACIVGGGVLLLTIILIIRLCISDYKWKRTIERYHKDKEKRENSESPF